MILLDTDHFSVFTGKRAQWHEHLNARMEAEADQIGFSIVAVEEVLRGWLAFIHRRREVHRQIDAYRRLEDLFNIVNSWTLVSFDVRAADRFTKLRRQRIRIGTMDLKIASVALVNNATLLTANLRDYSLVPDLRCENWLRP